jgi:hypothetical protein
MRSSAGRSTICEDAYRESVCQTLPTRAWRVPAWTQSSGSRPSRIRFDPGAEGEDAVNKRTTARVRRCQAGRDSGCLDPVASFYAIAALLLEIGGELTTRDPVFSRLADFAAEHEEFADVAECLFDHREDALQLRIFTAFGEETMARLYAKERDLFWGIFEAGRRTLFVGEAPAGGLVN